MGGSNKHRIMPVMRLFDMQQGSWFLTCCGRYDDLSHVNAVTITSLNRAQR